MPMGIIPFDISYNSQYLKMYFRRDCVLSHYHSLFFFTGIFKYNKVYIVFRTDLQFFEFFLMGKSLSHALHDLISVFSWHMGYPQAYKCGSLLFTDTKRAFQHISTRPYENFLLVSIFTLPKSLPSIPEAIKFQQSITTAIGVLWGWTVVTISLDAIPTE